MRRAHKTGPNLYRKAAAGRLPGRRVVVIAEPDPRYEIGGVADEPGVAEILAGPGLAGGWPARNFGFARGAGDQRRLHHGVHGSHMARIDRLAKRVRLARVQHLVAFDSA